MEWISVKDKMPEDGVCVIGYSDDIYMRTVYFNQKNDCFDDGNSWVIGITHWMPLPNPPKDTQERLLEASNTNYIPLKD